MMKTDKIKILYEDNHLLVVLKPENVLSQEDKSHDDDMLSILKRYLKETYHKEGNVYLGLVHRLDRRVGGVMVFAKTSKCASRLSEDIRNHHFHKSYLALVSGRLEGKKRLVNKLKKDDLLSYEDENGKTSELEYEVINTIDLDGECFSFVKINLLTGRYNQIRSQFSLIHHPLINDFKYGYRGKNYNDSLGLFCYQIIINHPITKEKMIFRSLPEGNFWELLKGENLEEI